MIRIETSCQEHSLQIPGFKMYDILRRASKYIPIYDHFPVSRCSDFSGLKEIRPYKVPYYSDNSVYIVIENVANLLFSTIFGHVTNCRDSSRVLAIS